MLPQVLMILTPLLILNHIFHQRKRNKKRKKQKRAKLKVSKSLAASLKSHKPHESVPKGETTTREKADSFRKIVADTLLHYGIKEWVYLKKIMDAFFDFDLQNQSGDRHTFIYAKILRHSSPSIDSVDSVDNY